MDARRPPPLLQPPPSRRRSEEAARNHALDAARFMFFFGEFPLLGEFFLTSNSPTKQTPQRHTHNGSVTEATGRLHGRIRQKNVPSVAEKNLPVFVQVLRRHEAIARTLSAMHSTVHDGDATERSDGEQRVADVSAEGATVRASVQR